MPIDNFAFWSKELLNDAVLKKINLREKLRTFKEASWYIDKDTHDRAIHDTFKLAGTKSKHHLKKCLS